jgi:hypothetical protein
VEHDESSQREDTEFPERRPQRGVFPTPDGVEAIEELD